jgi:YD repeat-containing protein
MDLRDSVAYVLLCASPLMGQSAMEEMFHIPHPLYPPLISLVRVMGMGQAMTDASLPVKGPVARVEYQEHNTFRLTDSPPALLRNLVQEFDEMGREVVETEVGKSRMVLTYRGDRPLTRKTTILRDGAASGPVQEQIWTYDAAGRLTEFRGTQGGRIANHFVGLRYDARGRITGREYRQGPSDAFQSRVEYEYSAEGQRITEVDYDEKNERIRTSIRILDDRGRIVAFEESARDWKTHEWGPPRHFRFGYDAKGRVIEQNAEPEKAGAFRDEQSIPDGLVSVAYDDEKGTREIIYSGRGIASRTIQKLDGNGAVSGLSSVTPAGKMSAEFECSYDAQGNWTECKRWGVQDGDRRLSGWWSRSITYR